MMTSILAVDFNNINSKIAYEMQKKGALLIDVRTEKEFNYAHAKGATLIPIFFEQFGQRVENREFVKQITKLVKNNKDRKILLICRSGSRTKYASQLLAGSGFTQVNNILYGFATRGGWYDLGLPIER